MVDRACRGVSRPARRRWGGLRVHLNEDLAGLVLAGLVTLALMVGLAWLLGPAGWGLAGVFGVSWWLCGRQIGAGITSRD